MGREKGRQSLMEERVCGALFLMSRGFCDLAVGMKALQLAVIGLLSFSRRRH